MPMEAESVTFIPTETYLTPPYQKEKYMKKFCGTVDELYAKKYFDDIVVKHAVYDQFRDDLAKDDTYDEVYEMVFSDVYGLPYPWPSPKPPADFPVDANNWAQKRIKTHFLVRQVLFHPYTMANMQEFANAIEEEFHFYNSKTLWLQVMYTPAGTKPELTHGQNIVWVIANVREVVNTNTIRAELTAIAKGVWRLCRRMCPCYISVRFAEIAKVTAPILNALPEGRVGEPYCTLLTATDMPIELVTLQMGTVLPDGLELLQYPPMIYGTPTYPSYELTVTITAQSKIDSAVQDTKSGKITIKHNLPQRVTFEDIWKGRPYASSSTIPIPEPKQIQQVVECESGISGVQLEKVDPNKWLWRLAGNAPETEKVGARNFTVKVSNTKEEATIDCSVKIRDKHDFVIVENEFTGYQGEILIASTHIEAPHQVYEGVVPGVDVEPIITSKHVFELVWDDNEADKTAWTIIIYLKEEVYEKSMFEFQIKYTDEPDYQKTLKFYVTSKQRA